MEQFSNKTLAVIDLFCWAVHVFFLKLDVLQAAHGCVFMIGLGVSFMFYLIYFFPMENGAECTVSSVNIK